MVNRLTPEEAEREIARAKTLTGRECGACSLCCRLLDVPEAGKPKHGWCPHCRPGNGGCTIYDRRPHRCRDWACLWLVDRTFGDEWLPLKSKIVIDLVYDEEAEALLLRFIVDPRFPNRWRQEPYYSTIKHLSLIGLRGGVNGDRYQTLVVIADEKTIILPNRECKFSPGIVLPTGPDHFEFIPCKDKEGVKKLDEFLQAFRRAGTRMQQSHPELVAKCSPHALFEIMAQNDPELRVLMEKLR